MVPRIELDEDNYILFSTRNKQLEPRGCIVNKITCETLRVERRENCHQKDHKCVEMTSRVFYHFLVRRYAVRHTALGMAVAKKNVEILQHPILKRLISDKWHAFGNNSRKIMPLKLSLTYREAPLYRNSSSWSIPPSSNDSSCACTAPFAYCKLLYGLRDKV